jgi:hypothetical protein
LVAGLGFSSGLAAGVACVILAGGVFTGGLVCVAAVFFVGCFGFTGITAGVFVAVPLVSAFLVSAFLVSAPFAATTGVGTTFAGTAAVCPFAGMVVVAAWPFVAGAGPLLAGIVPGFGVGVAAGAFVAVVPALVAGWVPVVAAFFVPGCAALPDLLAAVGVGDGVEFCAVANVAMAIASARICISFISIPFCALFIETFIISPEPLERPMQAALVSVALRPVVPLAHG